MADLFDSMKSIAKGTMESYGMCEPVIGAVISTSPLKVRLSERVVLDDDQVMLTQAVTEKRINYAHTHKSGDPVGLPTPLVVREGLEKGDEVLMLKAGKGQVFVILSKVVRE